MNKSIQFKDCWPPKPEELTIDYVYIPPSLQTFLHILLGGRENCSTRTNRLGWSSVWVH